MKIKKLGALLVSAVLCAGMAAPAFAFEGEATPVEQPVLPEVMEDVVTVTDETSGALTPEGNLTLVDDYHTDYSDGSGQQFITLVSKSGATFYLVIVRMIAVFKIFSSVNIMTMGSPSYANTSMVVEIYGNAFGSYKFGYAAAQSMVLFVLILVITLLNFWGQKKWVHY